MEGIRVFSGQCHCSGSWLSESHRKELASVPGLSILEYVADNVRRGLQNLWTAYQHNRHKPNNKNVLDILRPVMFWDVT